MVRIFQVREKECTPGKRNNMNENYSWERDWYIGKPESPRWPGCL